MANKIIKEIMSPAHHVNSDVRVDEAITYMLSKDTGAILIKNEQGKYVVAPEKPNFQRKTVKKIGVFIQQSVENSF